LIGRKKEDPRLPRLLPMAFLGVLKMRIAEEGRVLEPKPEHPIQTDMTDPD